MRGRWWLVAATMLGCPAAHAGEGLDLGPDAPWRTPWSTLWQGEEAPPITLEAVTNVEAAALGQLPDPLTWEALGPGVTVIEFWFTTCAPCVAMIPHLNEIAAEMGPKGVRFLAVTFEDAERVAKFLEKRPMKAWIGHDVDRSMINAYVVNGYPTTIIVKDGLIVELTSPERLSSAYLQSIIDGPKSPPPPPFWTWNDWPTAGERQRPAFHVPGLDPFGGIEGERPIAQVIVRIAERYGRSMQDADRASMLMRQPRQILAFAAGVPMQRVQGPDWIDQGRYDLVYLPPVTGVDAWRKAALATVAASFQAEAEVVDTMVEEWALTTAPGGPRFETARIAAPSQSEAWSSWSDQSVQLRSACASMCDLAKRIESVFADRMIVDESGDAGKYRFSLALPPSFEGVVTVLREEHGVILTKRMVPGRVLMVRGEGPPQFSRYEHRMKRLP